MSVCVYVYVYMDIHIHTHRDIYIDIDICICILMYTDIHMYVYIYISVHRCIALLCMRSEVVRGLIGVQSAVSQVLKWHRKLKGPKRLLGFQSRLVSFEDEQPCFLQRLKWFRTAETHSVP